MKKMKSILSVFLAALMLTLAIFPVSAASSLEEQWLNSEEAKRGITVNPGATESERNFSWYMAADVTECRVEISENEDMSDSKSFTGEIITTYQGDKSAKVTVTGLESEKTYYYTCVSGEEKSAVYSFTTDGDTFSALYMSDIHVYDNPEDETSLKDTSLAFAELIGKATAKAPLNLILAGGDLATEGQRVEYEGLTFSKASRELTFATIMGNHDRHSFDYKYFSNLPNEMYGPMSSYQSGNYYFEKGGVLFICIDTNNASAQAHRSTVKEAVKTHPDAKWRIVMMHHDLYGGSIPHRETECNLLRILFSPLFDEFNIDLVLMGHSHHYSISDVIYNGEKVGEIENGGTVNNARGTVYFVSTSIGRPEEEGEEAVAYSDRVAIGMDKLTDSYYNILDFSPEAIKVTSYNLETDEEYVSFTLTKDEDYEPEKIGFFRKLGGILAGFISNFYGIYVNADRYFGLKKAGYTGVGFFEYVF
ncbi:MAG: metallophosphoesterase family protein [Clostridia bacterium]|nr:metallophosphoesterase family protein [Clostridia bacterium]